MFLNRIATYFKDPVAAAGGQQNIIFWFFQILLLHLASRELVRGFENDTHLKIGYGILILFLLGLTIVFTG